jgi:hypothetical protein
MKPTILIAVITLAACVALRASEPREVKVRLNGEFKTVKSDKV